MEIGRKGLPIYGWGMTVKLKWMQWVLVVLGLTIWGAASAGTKHYYYTDPQGTVLAKADAQGNILATYDYAPYGAQMLGAPPSGPAGYTGHVNDAESGFVYMQARYYDPATGRFLSVDPMASGAGNIFDFNRYNYAENNPINKIDPDGRCPVCVIPACAATPCGAIVAAGAAALAVATINAIHETQEYFKQESRSSHRRHCLRLKESRIPFPTARVVIRHIQMANRQLANSIGQMESRMETSRVPM